MQKTLYRYITQIMPLAEEFQSDDTYSYFPNIYETIICSKPFENHTECINTCDLFLKDKLIEINSSSKNKYGIVWEYNPKFKSAIFGITEEQTIDNDVNWQNDEIVKYHIIKLSDLKTKNPKKKISSLLVSTIVVEQSENTSISVH